MSIVTRVGSTQTFVLIAGSGLTNSVITMDALPPAGRNRAVLLGMHLTDSSGNTQTVEPTLNTVPMTRIASNPPGNSGNKGRLFSWVAPVADIQGSVMTIGIIRDTWQNSAAGLISWYENVDPDNMYLTPPEIVSSTVTTVSSQFTPTSAVSDLAIGHFGWNNSSTLSFVNDGEGNFVSSGTQYIGSNFRESAVALVEANGESVATFHYSLYSMSGGAFNANYTGRINSFSLNHINVATKVETSSVDTWGIPVGQSRSTITISGSTLEDKALIVFGTYSNRASLGDTPPIVSRPTFGGVPMTEIARPAGGTNRVQLIAWTAPISNDSVSDYTLVCQKDHTDDIFHGVAVFLSNCSAAPSRISVWGVQAIQTAPIGFPVVLQPVTSDNSDLMLAACTNGSASTVTLTQLGDGVEFISNQTAGGTGTGFGFPGLSVSSSQGASNVSFRWSNNGTGTIYLRTVGLIIPVAGIDIPIGTGMGAYYMRRRAMNVY